MTWLLLPAVAAALGVLLHGPWALLGSAAGAWAAWWLHRRGAGQAASAFAASLPPLLWGDAAGIAAALGLVLAVESHRRWWVGAAGVGALVLAVVAVPAPWAPLLPALGGAFVLVAGPRPLALLGVPLGLTAGLMGAAWAAVAVGLLGAAALARWLASHPANLSVARSLAQWGLALAPLPAAAGLVLHALQLLPEPVSVVLIGATAAAGGGAVFLLAHLGLAVFVRTTDVSAGIWMVCAWAPLAAAAGLVLALSPGGAAAAAFSLAALSAIPAAVGLRWLLPRPLLGESSAVKAPATP